jgi:hypothetical protein
VATKCTFFYTCQQSLLGGWTESFYNVANTPPGPLSGTSDIAIRSGQLANALIDMHGRQTSMTFIRYSDPNTFRNVALFQVTDPPLGPLGNGLDTDYVTTALLLRLIGSDGTNTYVVNQWIRAMRDQFCDKNGQLILSGDFTTKFNALASVLVSNGWRLRVIDRSKPSQPVSAIDPLTGTVTCTGHGFADNAVVRIKGARGMPQANGIWRITFVDTNHFVLQHWIAPPTGVVLGQKDKVYVRLNVYTLVPISTVLAVRITSHQTGRPSYLRSGRRKTRKK